MSREILFRGVSKETKQIVYGAYFALHHNDHRTHIHHFIIPDNVAIPREKPIGEIQVEVDPATVGQFTEWEDDNNEKIFDGDILQVDDPQQDEPYTTTVRCEKGTYLVDVLDEDFDTCDIGYAISQIWDMNDCKYTVIGNIHDTKEEE